MARRYLRQLDMQRMAAAMAGPGMDPRLWVTYGTVSTGEITSGPDDDILTFDVTDQQAVAIGPSGVSVDVVLEPSMQLVTCHYAGMQGGKDCVVMAPIFAGDRVIVVLPNGSLGGSGPPVIVAVLNNDAEPLPLGPDRKPLFQNERVLVWAKQVPIDIRTAGGTRVLLNENGELDLEGSKVQLGAADATEQLMLGTTYRQAESKMNSQIINGSIPTNGLIAVAAAATAMLPSDVLVISLLAPTVATFLVALQAFFGTGPVAAPPNWLTALEEFEAGSNGYVSGVSKTK